MGMKITFFTKEGCREERLPDKNNEDHYVVLHGTFLGLNEALSVHFEVLEETWRICPEEGFIRPFRCWIRVDLPEPVRPMMPRYSPR